MTTLITTIIASVFGSTALSAISTCYFALAGIWGFPYAEQIVGTISAITTFIGILIGVSTIQYNKNQTSIKDIEDDLK